ncbi:MAG: DUF4215 domain-containing protein [Candidatus Kerfeldbacteria bacterium]
MKNSNFASPKYFTAYLITLIVAALFFVSIWLAWTFAQGETVDSFISSFTNEGTAQINLSFQDSLLYSYDVTKVDFGDEGMTLTNFSDQTDIVLMSPVQLFTAERRAFPATERIIGFTEQAVTGDGSQVNYQLSVDEENWIYYDGSQWANVGTCNTCYNTAEEINFNIGRLEVPSNDARIRVILKSGEKSKPVLQMVQFEVQGRKGVLLPTSPVLSDTVIAVATKAKVTIDVDGSCDDVANQVTFTITNDSNQDMPENSEYSIFRDGILEDTGTFKLDAHETKQIIVVGNGDKVRFETKKYPTDSSKTEIAYKDVKDCGEPEVTEPECGNAVLEDGEECDDGNLEDGDGCSAVCEEEFSCPTEVYDALEAAGKDKGKVGNWCFTFEDGWSDCGFSQSNDADIHDMVVHISCSAEYTDGYPDKGEPVEADGDPAVTEYSITQYDVDKDGVCTIKKTCESEDGEEPYCGDGSLDPGEECDDGNTANGDGCSAQCDFEDVPECGNAIVEEGEECDDGNDDNNDFCSNQCDNRTPICHATSSEANPYNILWVPDDAIDGEGHDDHQHHEDDIIPIWDVDQDGEIDEEDCIKSTYECGDGKIDPGEQCDDGNTDDGDGCSALCTTEQQPACGDGKIDPGEQCDDGNTDDGDGCSAQCTVEEEPACGDGNLDPGEECDDGNTDDGDGCSHKCDLEKPECGNGIVEEGEECDDGNNENNDFCTNKCEHGNPICHATSSETHPFNLLWVPDDAIDGEGQSDHRHHEDDIIPIWDVNGDGFITEEDCDATLPECGNGILEDGEECDDGNTNDGDGCSALCLLPECGNGIVEEGEDCDDGNTDNGDGCSNECTYEENPECGDGIVDPGEQ